jgi:CHAT domain-containing protein
LLNRNPKGALVAATSADSLTRVLSLTTHAITARTLKGRALVDQGTRAAGLAELQAVVALADAHPSTEALRSTNQALGDALVLVGRDTEALRAYDRAGAAVEKMTAGLNDDSYRTGFKALHLAPFDGALRVLLRGAGTPANADAALAWSIRRKAAALTLAGQPGATGRRTSITDLRNRLAADEALIDYTVLDSAVVAIVVRRDTTRRFVLSVPAAQLATWIDALRRPLVTTPGGQIDLAHAPFDAAVAASLHSALIEPLSSALLSANRLAIAPDGALWYAPFAALVTGRANGRRAYLIERYEVRLLPSAQFLSARNGSALPTNFRVDALTYSVPGGDTELQAIRSALGTDRVIARNGAKATERSALSSSANVLHLAVHGVVDDRDPLASHLQMAPDGGDDGLLHLSEVAARRLTPQLVVLTACEAVSGKLYAAEGLVGLARAFLVGGARQVIASEWPVAASAAELSGGLYRELAKGRSPAAALRSAQLSLLNSPATAHPIHWAGFVTFDGR